MADRIEIDHWTNVRPDLPVTIPPPLSSDGGDEIANIQRLIPRGLLYLSTSKKRRHPIPDDVRTHYANLNRPTPLMRAARLERHLGTRSRIYFKREDILPPGSFKMNSVIAQVARAHIEGFRQIISETGAGQWGMALSMACAIYGLKCRIYMPLSSQEHKRERVKFMRLHGAEVIASPSRTTAIGRELAGEPRYASGSIGTAVSEAVAFAQELSDCAYLSGGSLPYVSVHQSIIGLESALQLRQLGETPTALVACVGSGSNFSGFVLPLVYGAAAFQPTPKMLACESRLIPRLSEGAYEYDSADVAGLTPRVKGYTLGWSAEMPVTQIAGMRQHISSSMIGALNAHGYLAIGAYDPSRAFEVGRLVARVEGFLPAPETCHAVCGVLELIEKAESRGAAEVIVACISGSGLFDLDAYADGGGA